MGDLLIALSCFALIGVLYLRHKRIKIMKKLTKELEDLMDEQNVTDDEPTN